MGRTAKPIELCLFAHAGLETRRLVNDPRSRGDVLTDEA